MKSMIENSHRIALPTHIILGREDKAIPFEQAYIAVKIPPDSSVQIIDRCGHLPQVECSGEFNQLVLEFLAH